MENQSTLVAEHSTLSSFWAVANELPSARYVVGFSTDVKKREKRAKGKFSQA